VGDVKSVIKIIKMAVRDDSGGMHQLDENCGWKFVG
jgi:hypothetical protein